MVDSYLHLQAGRGVNAVLVELRGRHRRAGPRHRRPHRLRPARPTSAARTSPRPRSTPSGRRSRRSPATRASPRRRSPKIVEGRLNGWFKERVLLEQPYVKDEKQTDRRRSLGRRDRAVRPGRRRRLRSPGRRWRRRRHRVGVHRTARSSSRCRARRWPRRPPTRPSTRPWSSGSPGRSPRPGPSSTSSWRSMVGGGNIWRGTTGAGAGHGPGHLGHHGDAGHGHQRAGPPGRPRAPRPAHPGALGRPDGRGGRALHPAPGHPPPREGPGGDLRRGHGQPVLHDRHLGRPAGGRDRGRAAAARAPTAGSTGSTAPTPGSTRRPPATTSSPSWTWSAKDLRVMDLTAITFCKDNGLPDPGVRPDGARATSQSCARRRARSVR